jgi:FlaA1/EpsC-like NDP-sugar epimerase
VLKSAQIAQGGEIFILKMPALKVKHIAEIMIERLAPKYGYSPQSIKIKIIGKRNGEKSFEDLMTEEESRHALEIDDMFVIQGFNNQNINNCELVQMNPYTSKDVCKLTKEEVDALLACYL